MTYPITRRDALAGATALLASQPVIARSGAFPTQNHAFTPVLSAFAEWDALRVEVDQRETDQGLTDGLNEMLLIEDRIASMPSTCMADLAAKYLTWSVWGRVGVQFDCSDVASHTAEMVELVRPYVIEGESRPVEVLDFDDLEKSVRNSDPVVVAYDEWLAARREWRELAELPGNGDFDDPRSLAAEYRERVAMFEMLQNEPTSLAGIGALAALLWSDVSPGFIDPIEFERRANYVDCLATEAIWKACTGKDGYPDV